MANQELGDLPNDSWQLVIRDDHRKRIRGEQLANPSGASGQSHKNLVGSGRLVNFGVVPRVSTSPHGI